MTVRRKATLTNCVAICSFGYFLKICHLVLNLGDNPLRFLYHYEHFVFSFKTEFVQKNLKKFSLLTHQSVFLLCKPYSLSQTNNSQLPYYRDLQLTSRNTNHFCIDNFDLSIQNRCTPFVFRESNLHTTMNNKRRCLKRSSCRAEKKS
jgi:hypothetical protein